ncbi:MAG: hypothetical protein KAR79_03450, partial [Simkaniaceae bacterium]|nr:hypothetical protein [Simkaniaceae bacterium]
QVLTDREWAAASRLCQKTVLPSKDLIQFVFYKNSEIIGYVEVTKNSNIQTLHMSKDHRDLGCEKLFLEKLRRWLSSFIKNR